MRVLTLMLAIVALSLAGCGGSDSSSTPTARATLPGSSPAASGVTPIATSTPAGGTPGATATVAPPPAAGETVEVTGIVGTVTVATQSIEIKRLQGANVTRLEIGPRTVIHKAAGGTAQLRDIRPSDRLVAKGVLNDRGDALVVSEITVQDILPGAQPGG